MLYQEIEEIEVVGIKVGSEAILGPIEEVVDSIEAPTCLVPFNFSPNPNTFIKRKKVFKLDLN